MGILTILKTISWVRAITLLTLIYPQILFMRALISELLISYTQSVAGSSLFVYFIQIWNFFGMTDNILTLLGAYFFTWANKTFLSVINKL